jgi:hypothetical protein
LCRTRREQDDDAGILQDVEDRRAGIATK